LDQHDDCEVEVVGGLARRRATVISWAVFTAISLFYGHQVLNDDFRHHLLVGDSASYLLQAESLGFAGHNLSYDAKDSEYFRSFGWAQVPYGLFVQKNDDGWAFAKPYGYSVVLTPFIRAFGPRYGVSLANLSLLSSLGVLGWATLRRRYDGPIVPLVLGTFLFASPFIFYTFHIYVEVFWASLVMATLYALARAAEDRSLRWALAGAVLAGFLVSEKVPALTLILPLTIVVICRLPTWPKRAAVTAAAATTLVIACVPYLTYSDGASWNPYGGDRYYVSSQVPFDGHQRGFGPVGTSETFSLTYAKDMIFTDIPDKGKSTIYYFVGRHTGLLPFTPFALFVLIAAVVAFRRIDSPGRAVLLGILGYIAFYVIFFPRNYNGGGQTLGNRYFLQIYPAILVLFVLFEMRVRSIVVGSVASAAIAVTFMSQHYGQPSRGILDIDKTNSVQRLLPFESNQDGAAYFRCGVGVCPVDGDLPD
jgi:hypothetical protein